MMKHTLKLYSHLSSYLGPAMCSMLLFGSLPVHAQSLIRNSSIDGRYGATTQLKQGNSRVVITVGEPTGCSSGFGLDAGFGSGESWNSSSTEEFEFYQVGKLASRSQTGRLSRQFGSTSTFQLGNSSQPDITGCVDESRNTVFINLRPKIIREQPIPMPVPNPVPNPIPVPNPDRTQPQPQPQPQTYPGTIYYPSSTPRLSQPRYQPQPDPIR